MSKSNKVWICLFTCCVTRAVHLELVLDLSAVTFIRCLKRFAARRGLPRKIVSDNAKTFKAPAKSTAELLNGGASLTRNVGSGGAGEHEEASHQNVYI